MARVLGRLKRLLASEGRENRELIRAIIKIHREPFDNEEDVRAVVEKMSLTERNREFLLDLFFVCWDPEKFQQCKDRAANAVYIKLKYATSDMPQDHVRDDPNQCENFLLDVHKTLLHDRVYRDDLNLTDAIIYMTTRGSRDGESFWTAYVNYPSFFKDLNEEDLKFVYWLMANSDFNNDDWWDVFHCLVADRILDRSPELRKI